MESHINNSIDEKIFDQFYNLLDTYDINNNNNNKELDDIKNYLAGSNNMMKISILELIKKIPDISKSFYNNIENFLNFKININYTNFYENYINNFLNIFPNIVLNKNIDTNKIPSTLAIIRIT